MTQRILIGLLLHAFAVQAVSAQADSVPAQTSRLCVLPVQGEQGLHYEGGERVDSLAWGPSALTVAPDGRFVIADAARSRLVEYGSDCAFRRVLDLSDKVAGITDVKVTGEGYSVLDAVAEEPVVLQLDNAARVLRRFPVAESLARELPSLAVEDGDRVLLGLREGMETVPLREAGAPVAPEARLAGLRDRGVGFVTSLEKRAEGGQRLSLSMGSRSVEIDSDLPVESFTLLGVAGERHVYARAIEVTVIAGTLRVRESVYRVAPSGRVDGVARELFADQHVFVQNRLAVDSGRDRVLALLTFPDRAEIHQLVFSDPAALAPRSLPESGESADELAIASIFEAAEEEARCKIYPGQIRRIANGYINNSIELSRANIEGTCEKRTKPPYLTAPGTYRSIPYDWNGFDSVADFNEAMKKGAQAGDVGTKDFAACSKGVDCSGFVSRTWGLRGKRGSATIGQISTRLASQRELRFGDILNKDNHHVSLIDSVADNTVNIYESVTEGHNKVVRRATPWSRYNGYKMLRYNHYCEKAASQIGCVGQSAQLFVDVPVNLTGGRFSGQGRGQDYDGDQLYFKVSGDFDRATRNLEVTLTFYTDPGFSSHVRTDRCVGPLNERDQFSDALCELVQNTSASCPIYLLMSLRGESGATVVPEPSASPARSTIRD